MRHRHSLLALFLGILAGSGCKRSEPSATPVPPVLAAVNSKASTPTVSSSSRDTLVLWYCGGSGRIGFDTLGDGDTVFLFEDRPVRHVWNGVVDSMATPNDGAFPLRSIDLPCGANPFRVAVLNPASNDFQALELDTLPDATTWLDPDILSQARRFHPDTVPQGDGPPYVYDFYRFPPRAYRERGTSGDPLVLQYGCGPDQWCGPLFRVVGRKLSALRGGASDGPPVLFRHGGRMHLYLGEGLGEGGDVWMGIHRFDADTITTLAIDGRYSN